MHGHIYRIATSFMISVPDNRMNLFCKNSLRPEWKTNFSIRRNDLGLLYGQPRWFCHIGFCVTTKEIKLQIVDLVEHRLKIALWPHECYIYPCYKWSCSLGETCSSSLNIFVLETTNKWSCSLGETCSSSLNILSWKLLRLPCHIEWNKTCIKHPLSM